MAKKQFIRHLEFYGFPDQNGYASDINGANVDLSEIIKKNKEQDEEIKELTDEKASKNDLDSLSGTVDTLISAQTEFNNTVVETISGITNDINTLKEVDNEFAEQLSAITSGVDDAMEAIELLGERVDDVEDAISGINDSIETIIEDYAKKEDVYFKEEIDEMISSGFSGYATQEWVEEQGYITEEEADARYAKITDLEELASAVESAATDIDEKFDEINNSIDEINSSIDEINDKVDDLAEDLSAFSEDVASALSDVNDKISGITDDIADLSNAISGNTAAIDELKDTTSANTEAIENLNDAVSGLNADIQDVKDELETKADVSDLQDLHSEMTQGFDNIEDKKADKTDLDAVSDTVDTIRQDLDAEIARSTNVDATMQEKIDQLEGDVEEAVETVDTFDERIAAVEDGLAQEISDRKQADLDLIGNEEDSRDADTIWGAKNYAKEMKRQAINEAEVYTDDKVAGFSTELANLEAEMNQKFTGYATTAYVESRISEEETVITNDYNTKINSEKQRAIAREDAISDDMLNIKLDIISATTEIAHNATRINAITEWDGSDPAQYDDSGNGILDVLHREFHEYEKTHGAIKNIEFVDGNLIITYETPEGEKQEIIPISELIVLDDYYTKEDTDALLAEKLDVSAYTDVSEQVSANTENIQTLSGDVETLEEELSGKTDLSLFNALVERLGYTDNETLQRNNEHEVAFGSYNVSNTDSEASGQTIFSVGIGTGDEDRKNALEVRNDGSVYMWVEGDYMNVNLLLAQIAHEVYDADTTNNSHFFDGD